LSQGGSAHNNGLKAAPHGGVGGSHVRAATHRTTSGEATAVEEGWRHPQQGGQAAKSQPQHILQVQQNGPLGPGLQERQAGAGAS